MFAISRLLCLVAMFVCAAVSSAQQKLLIPEKLERATVVDENGVTQWAEHKAAECPNCVGKGKVKCTTCERFSEEATTCPDCERKEGHLAVCRMCAGEGTLPDPLEKAMCPGCQGAGFLICTVCAGGGGMRIGGAKQWSDCPACRGSGRFDCGACDGKRHVEGAGLKPSMAEAKDKDLQKAMQATDAALKQLEKYATMGGGKVRKDVKALQKIFESVQSTYPALKRLSDPFEDYMGKIYAGAQFQGSDENEAETIMMVKNSAEYFLKHQKRMLELVQKRAEANAKLGEAGKDEKAGKDAKGK
ncbi:MAG: hypothetical protein ABL997_02175 [Planctomycetota bacterium]